jgi:hypothetical protein
VSANPQGGGAVERYRRREDGPGGGPGFRGFLSICAPENGLHVPRDLRGARLRFEEFPDRSVPRRKHAVIVQIVRASSVRPAVQHLAVADKRRQNPENFRLPERAQEIEDRIAERVRGVGPEDIEERRADRFIRDPRSIFEDVKPASTPA